MCYKKSDFLSHFFCQNIWSYQKFVVPLHPLSLKNGTLPNEPKQTVIFERLSIHNKM